MEVLTPHDYLVVQRFAYSILLRRSQMFSPSGGSGGFNGGSSGKSPWKAKGEIGKSRTNFTAKHMYALIGSDEQAISKDKPPDEFWVKVVDKTNKKGERMPGELPDLLVNTPKGMDSEFQDRVKDICKIGPCVCTAYPVPLCLLSAFCLHALTVISVS